MIRTSPQIGLGFPGNRQYPPFVPSPQNHSNFRVQTPRTRTEGRAYPAKSDYPAPLWYPPSNIIRHISSGSMGLSGVEYGMGRVRGLGEMSQGLQSILVSTPGIVGGVLTAGGSASITAAIWGAAAIPVVGAIVAGVTIGLMALFARKGPKQKVATTEIVDKVEPLLKQNRDGYLTGPRTVTAQQQAINNFHAGWQFVVEHCNIPEMGDPGQRCTSERSRGGKWDWYSYYLDPILNDIPNPDPVISPEIQAGIDNFNQAVDGAVSGLGLGTGGLLVAGGVLLGLALLVGGGN